MKTGIELINDERNEQLDKHNRSVQSDVDNNKNQQLTEAAITLLDEEPHELTAPPHNWGGEIWYKMLGKSYKERLIIAGALIAAEIDRLQALKV
jgi:hypothetical protein